MIKERNSVYEVDISKLYDGKVYKNYKALVTEQGWKYNRPTSKSGIAQKKQLDAVCRWGYETNSSGKKISNKVIIHEVFENPLIVVDNRQWQEASVVSNLMVNKLLKILKEEYLSHRNTKIGKTPLEWAMVFGLCSQDFIDFRTNPVKPSEELNIKLEHTFDFLDNTYANIRHRLNSTFGRLEDLGLISVSTEVWLRYEELNIYSKPTKKQLIFIKEIEEKFLKTTPKKVLWSSYHNGVGRNYVLYKKVVEKVKKRALKSIDPEIRTLSTIKRYKTVTEIKVVSDELLKWWKGEETKLDVNYLGRYLELSDSPFDDINHEFVNRLITNIELRKPTSIEEATETDILFRRNDIDYIKNIKTLINTYIKIN